MIRTVFLTLLAIVGALVILGLFLPRQIVIERERVIDQPREIIFEVLQDFRHFQQWSPWFQHMPDADIRIEGPAAGIGSTLVWNDPRNERGGRLWMVGLDRFERIDMALELSESEAENYFLIETAEEPGYRVRWGMQMEVASFDLVGRYTGLLLQRLVGRDYSEGLDRLADYLNQTPGRVPPLTSDLEFDSP